MTSPVIHMPERQNVDAEIGRRIFHLMWDAKITATEMGRRLGIQQSAMSKKLRGERPWYTDELVTAAAILGVSVGYLFGETEKAPDPKVGGLSLPGLDSNQEPADFQPREVVHVDFTRREVVA